MVLLLPGQQGDVLLDAVVAAAGVGEHVAVDAAGVIQQVPHGDGLGHFASASRSSGRTSATARRGRASLVDELHGQVAVTPWTWTDLEQRVGGRLDLRRDVRVP